MFLARLHAQIKKFGDVFARLALDNKLKYLAPIVNGARNPEAAKALVKFLRTSEGPCGYKGERLGACHSMIAVNDRFGED